MAMTKDLELNAENESDVTQTRAPSPGEPPDGGYGWMVVLCVWFTLVIMSGTNSSFGLMQPYFLSTFQAGDVNTVATITVMFVIMFGICVVAGSLCDTFGCRVVAMMGNVIAAVGLVIAAFASSFVLFFCSYGIMCGVGFGLSYMGNIMIIQQYFSTKRSIALGISNTGIGIGMFVYAPLTTYLLEEYSWRGTLLLMAGIWFNGLVTSSMLRPVPQVLLPLPPSPDAAGEPEPIKPSLLHTSLPELIAGSCSQLSMHSYKSLDAIKEEPPPPTPPPPQKSALCGNLMASVKNLLDVRAFVNVYVILFTLVPVFAGAFPMIPVYLPRKCEDGGMETSEAALLISLAGLADVAGRIIFGSLGYRIDYTYLYTTCLFMTGVCLTCIAFGSSFWFILVPLVTGYVFYGGYAVMMPVTIVQFVGVQYLARVLGFVLFGTGIGFILAGPFVAQIYTVSGSYGVVFVVCGCMQLMAACLCVLILVLRALSFGTIHREPPAVTMDVNA